MMQSKMMKRYTPKYVVVENGFLTYYDKKSLVGTKKNKVRTLNRCFHYRNHHHDILVRKPVPFFCFDGTYPPTPLVFTVCS